MTMFFLGAGSLGLVGLVSAMVIDEDMRRAFVQLAAALLMGPVILLLSIVRRGPRLARLSPEALIRFCRQVDQDMRPAWVLSMGSRGVVFIRRRSRGWWRNNVPNRAVDASRGRGSGE